MKIWVDDIRPAPDGWTWVKSVREAKTAILYYEHQMIDDTIIISLDHDAGDYSSYGGDYIKILDWLEEKRIVDTGYFFHLHTQNSEDGRTCRLLLEKIIGRKCFK